MSSVFGTTAAQSLAGMNQAKRTETREKEKGEQARRGASAPRREDEDTVVVKVEAGEAARHVEANDQEEAHEDRQEKAGTYSPSGRRGAPAPESIDLEG